MTHLPDGTMSLAACFRRWSNERPTASAVTCGSDTLSWLALERRTNRVARALQALGVRHGTFVTIALPNGIDFIVATMAAWKLGAVPQPVSARLPKAELDAIVALARPAAIFAEASLDIDHPMVDVATLLANCDDDSPLPERISPSWKAPTSGGSTGRPKLIVSGQPGVVDAFGIALWRLEPDGVNLMPGPLYHNGPFASAMAGLMAGGHLVLMPKFDALQTLELVERHRATWLYLVPTMMNRIWRLDDAVRDRFDLSSLRTVWHLAAPCPPWLKQAWIDWLGGGRIWELYGGTESQAATTIDGLAWQQHRGSVGRAAYGELCVLDDQGHSVPNGETGEIYLRRTAGTPPSYHYVGAEARACGDWESLGDYGWMDAEGYLYITDRSTDMILVGGANVYPAEVEAALESYPSVISSAVIGLPDEDLGARIHAIVQARPGLDRAALHAHLATRLAYHKRPRSIEIVDTPLRDDAGKSRRSRLRQDRIAAPMRGVE